MTDYDKLLSDEDLSERVYAKFGIANAPFDIADAWLVVEKMLETRLFLFSCGTELPAEVGDPFQFNASFYSLTAARGDALSDSLPRAISIAALRATDSLSAEAEEVE